MGVVALIGQYHPNQGVNPMQEEPVNEPDDTLDHEQLESAEPQVTLSRRKRGIGPVVGMPCRPGYKLIGDDCVIANIDFE